MEAAFSRAGIGSAEELREMGADAAYAKLLRAGRHRPHFIAYYSMVMGLQGWPWNDAQGQEKARLRARFDALVAEALGAKDKGRSELEAALDAIGVVAVVQPTSSRPEKK